MISFVVGKARFNFRAAAVIIDQGHVLLHRAAHEDTWALPGGRVEMGEASATTITRELAEELGPAFDAQVGRLLWVIENFYRREDVEFHGLGMYYLVTLNASSPYLAKDRVFSGREDDLALHEGGPVPLIFQWFRLDALARAPLYPFILRSRLTALPAATELLTNDERRGDWRRS